MKNFLLLLICFSGLLSGSAQTPDTIIFSDGALISIYDTILIDGTFLHQGNDTMLNEGNIFITGNWINNNSTNKIFNNGPDGWVHLTGDSQSIGGTTLTLFNNLELAGTGVKQLNSIDTEVEDTLALNDRELSAGDNTAYILNPGTGVVTRSNSMTGGFVSSTNNGGLSRKTLSAGTYQFPVGSSFGTPRYRPVDLTPSTSSSNTFKVRMANADPTSETFDITLKDSSLCSVNSGFYHRISRSTGTDSASIKIYFDSAIDGNFQTIAHWQSAPGPQWGNTGSSIFFSSSPFSSLEINSWSDFSTFPFALATNSPAKPTVNASGPTSFCSGGSVTLIADTGYTSYLWSNGDTTSTTVITTSGSYSVTVSNGSACTDSSATINVNSNPLPSPVISSSGSSAFCAGDTLDAGNGFPAYNWSTGETSQTIIADSAGIYSVTITDANGCPGSSAITINNPVPLITADDTTSFCSGENVELNAGSGFSSYLWSNGQTDQSVIIYSSGSFSVTVTDAQGCTGVSQSATTITVHPLPNVFASPDDTINFGSSDTLFAYGGISYQWEPGNTTENKFIVSPTTETLYTITGKDAKGCVDTALVKIYVDTRCIIAIPNIFSPNGDGKHEEFEILGHGFELNNLTIFDRWGKKILETQDGNTGWNGKIDNTGNPLNSGVYVYSLKYKCLLSGEEIEKHGNITLTR